MDDGERYNTSTSLMGTNTNADPNYARSGKIMLCSVVSIIAIVILLAGFHSYARWVFHREQERERRRRFIQRQRNRHLIFASDLPTTTPNNSRLDPSLLKSLPTFLYSSTTHAPSLNCAVCLSEFEEKEKGRLLPSCKHCFHVDCIDMWFHAHSNCPLCRAPVRPDISVAPAEEPVERVLWLDEPAELSFGLYPPPGQRGGHDRPCSCSCPCPCSSSSSRGVPELVGITVELPRRNDIGFRHFEDQLGLNSPGQLTGRR